MIFSLMVIQFDPYDEKLKELIIIVQAFHYVFRFLLFYHFHFGTKYIQKIIQIRDSSPHMMVDCLLYIDRERKIRLDNTISKHVDRDYSRVLSVGVIECKRKCAWVGIEYQYYFQLLASL